MYDSDDWHLADETQYRSHENVLLNGICAKGTDILVSDIQLGLILSFPMWKLLLIHDMQMRILLVVHK